MAESIKADLLLGRDTLSPGLLKAGQAASDASSNIRQLTRDLYAAGRVRATPVVDLNDAAATAKLGDLAAKLRDIGARVADPKIDLNDKAAVLKVADMRVKLDRLGRQVASPRITLEGLGRAEAQLLRLDAQLGDLKVKQRDFSIGNISKSLVNFNALKGLLTGTPGTLGAFPSFLASPGGIAAGAGVSIPGVPILASLIDAALGTAIGGATAGAGFLGVQKFNPGALAPGLSNITRSLSSVFQSIGPSVGLMIAQLGQFTKNFKPVLASLFGASLPFMKSFLTVAEQAAKTILPAFTQAMNEMVKSGALKQMTQAFVYLTQGVAEFVNAIGGPGMKAGAEIFRGIAIGIRTILDAVGNALGFLGSYTSKELPLIRQYFDHFRHDIAAIWSGVYHDTISVWETIWSNTVGRVERGVADVETWFGKLQPGIRGLLGGLGKMLLGIGTSAMSSFLSGLKSIGGSVLSWLKNFVGGIPGFILHFLGMSPPHPGSVFFDLGANIMHHFEAGIQSRARSVLGSIGSAVGRGTGATAGGIQALAYQIAKARGWATQWGAIEAVEMAEAGWNLTARNPSSGAYGIAQFINGPREYYQYGGNPNTAAGQIVAFFNYIAQRYGSPSAAWAHEQAYHWYGSGGMITEPVLGVGLRTGSRYGFGERGPEMVIPAGGGGAQQIVLTIAPGAEGRLTGVLLEVLRKEIRIRGGSVQQALGRP